MHHPKKLTRSDEVFNLVRIVRSDEVARLTCADAGLFKNATVMASAIRMAARCGPLLNARSISAPIFGTLDCRCHEIFKSA
jgi:hypothetical protein